MEDENGIELSLGLSCGGSSSKSKVKDGLVETTSGEGFRTRAVFDPSLKPYIRPQTQVADMLIDHREGKRKLRIFEETNPQKKIEKKGAYRGHVSLREDASSAELDEATESEAEGSSSKGVDREQGGDLGKSTFDKVPLTLQALTGRASLTQSNGFSSKCGMPLLPGLHQPISSSAIHQAFGYSSVQLPCMETSSSWIFGSAPANNLDHVENGSKISSAPRSEAAKVSGSNLGKQPDEIAGTSISAHVGDEPRPTSGSDAVSSEISGIKPGIAANLIFGGSGSRPDLPWVSTTGPGPNGKTISGVTYKFSPTQVKIVCACHGSHMTPEEFIQHASSVPSENHGSTNNSAAPG